MATHRRSASPGLLSRVGADTRPLTASAWAAALSSRLSTGESRSIVSPMPRKDSASAAGTNTVGLIFLKDTLAWAGDIDDYDSEVEHWQAAAGSVCM